MITFQGRRLLSFRTFSFITVCFPTIGFISSVLLSLIYNFQEANHTHCYVTNYLPSVSAAVGRFYPQMTIWASSIGFSTILRLIVHYYCMQEAYYKSTEMKESFSDIVMVPLLTLVHMLELLGLLLLSLVSSSENFDFHKNWFITFMVAAFVYMTLHLYFYYQWMKNQPHSHVYYSVFVQKCITYFINVGSIQLSGFFYWRHTNYCEPFVYTLFAFFEYVVILSNIYFHYQVAQDVWIRKNNRKIGKRCSDISLYNLQPGMES